jgi:sulfate transport system substrate-binding protein
VLIAWENEAFLSINEFGKDKFEACGPFSCPSWPSRRSRWSTKVVDKKGTRAPAEAYLKFLYTPEGQEIAARHFYRPRDEVVAKNYEGSFPKVDLFSIDDSVRWLEEGADHAFQGWRYIRLHLRPVTRHAQGHGPTDCAGT